MCCLNYEQSTYEQMWKDTPRRGSLVKTPNGKEGTVFDVSVLTGIIKVQNPETGVVTAYHKSELKILKHAIDNDDIDPEIKEIAKD